MDKQDGEAASVIDGQMRILAEHLIGATPSGKVKWALYNNEFITHVEQYQINLIPSRDSNSIGMAVKIKTDQWRDANSIQCPKDIKTDQWRDANSIQCPKDTKTNDYLLLAELLSLVTNVRNELLDDVIKSVRKLNKRGKK